MSISAAIVWTGLNAFKNHVTKKIPRVIEESAEAATDRAGDEGLDRMQRSCPVKTGRLLSTCRKRTESYPGPERFYEVSLLAGGEKGVDYAGYVERGTSKQRPQPYLGPAVRWAAKRVPILFWEEFAKRT